MRKNILAGSRKHKGASNLSISAAAFISALFLSLLCGLFYNMWNYEAERAALEKGDWHSRISASLNREELAFVQNYAAVEKAKINVSSGEKTVDLYFRDKRSVFEDTERIADFLNLPSDAISYNYELLSLYLVRSPSDPAPRLLLPLFLLILLLACLSLIIIIHNAFSFSMNGQIHQLGVLSSIGATPAQIRSCLLRETLSMCALPVVAGNILGFLISMGIVTLSNTFPGNQVPGRHEAVFRLPPLIFLGSLLVCALTLWISARIPAGRLSRLTPLEAIRNTKELELTHRKKSPVLSRLFGIEGELAGNALKAQRKALRTSNLSLFLAFLAFVLMQSFFTLSQISTRETYFERYRNTWDLMITLPDTDISAFGKTEEVQAIPGVRSAIVYQRAMAKRLISQEEISEAMKAFGGFSHSEESQVQRTEKGYLVNAPLVILDDTSFLSYCEQAGAAPSLEGSIIWNKIRDVTNPDFRHRRYVPYLKENQGSCVLLRADSEEMTAEIPVLSYTETLPALREEFAATDYYELVHILPVSLWEKVKGQIGGSEENTYICMLVGENASREAIQALQEKTDKLLAEYEAESENRIQKLETNDRQIQGMMTVFGVFCVLLALIGVGNVFSNTTGFVRQRRREFARYLSVGMTPGELRKMFCIEALVVAVRPIFTALLLSVPPILAMMKMSYMEVSSFLAEAPVFPIAAFVLAVWAGVVLAYWSGFQSVRRLCLTEILRDETMV